MEKTELDECVDNVIRIITEDARAKGDLASGDYTIIPDKSSAEKVKKQIISTIGEYITGFKEDLKESIDSLAKNYRVK